MEESLGLTKRCFVTIGATAPFDRLLRAVLSDSFLAALLQAGFNDLRIQHGKDSGLEIFSERYRQLESEGVLASLTISGFAYSQSGLHDDMIALKAREKNLEGMMVSHAGSGSILEALRYDIPTIVVPNTALLHNHQLELAEALSETGYVVHGNLDNLASSIAKLEKFREQRKQWPPPTAGPAKYKNGIADVVAEEMGWQLD